MKQKRLVVFGGSFNPPGLHHLALGQQLQKLFDIVLIYPCGLRPDKETTNSIDGLHRRALVNMTFDQGFWVDSSDIEKEEFTRSFDLDHLIKKRHQSIAGEVWHAVGADLVVGGHDGQSQIQTSWYRGSELWQHAKFLVVTRGGKSFDQADLPPHSQLLEVNIPGSSTEIRQSVQSGESITHLVVPRAAEYIRKHGLYK